MLNAATHTASALIAAAMDGREGSRIHGQIGVAVGEVMMRGGDPDERVPAYVDYQKLLRRKERECQNRTKKTKRD